VLGLLPPGTDAVEVIASGRVANVDLARVGDDYFVNTAVLGLPAMVARSTPHALKNYFGKAGYAFVGPPGGPTISMTLVPSSTLMTAPVSRATRYGQPWICCPPHRPRCENPIV
jgi:hypothetical protein